MNGALMFLVHNSIEQTHECYSIGKEGAYIVDFEGYDLNISKSDSRG